MFNSELNYVIINQDSKKQKHVVLLGASVGKAWNISSLPGRVNNSDYNFEYILCRGFDKSEKLRQVIMRKGNKPDAIFIKECAAYFPGDMKSYKSSVEQWIKECFEADVIPIPTTVVPVTRLHPFKIIMIDIIRGRNLFKYGNQFKNRRNKAILDFNDWVRMYGKKNDLSILDLEAAVRYSRKNRNLREDLARIDGLHLNSKAYKVLDQIVIPALKTVKWES